MTLRRRRAAAGLRRAFRLPLRRSRPFRYRQVVGLRQEALLTAFIANSAFIVLPMLVERANALMAQYGHASAEAESTLDVLVPSRFICPNAGKLLTLLFVPFAAWLSGDPLGAASYLALFAAPASQLLRQGPGGAAFPDGSARRAARPVPALHSIEHHHRQIRFDGLGDEPAGAGAADGQAASAGGCGFDPAHRPARAGGRCVTVVTVAGT